MAEMVIAFRQPPSLTPRQMHAWVIDWALERQRALVLSGPEEAPSHGFLLRVRVDDDAPEAAQEELTDLMTEMRLLGFRPAVLDLGG
jgi:hypothetical protein